jgi:hypothetical protein
VRGGRGGRWRRVSRGLVALAGAGGLALSVAVAAAQPECARLPAAAKRPRPCNPQTECLRQIPKESSGAEREAAARECRRQPTSGICYGPETYDPRAECRQKARK